MVYCTLAYDTSPALYTRFYVFFTFPWTDSHGVLAFLNFAFV